MGQRVGDLAGNAERVVDRELLLTLDAVAERFPLFERHDIEEESADDTGIEQRNDVRMLETCRDLDFTQKPMGAGGGAQLRSHHLDRDGPMMLQVLGEVDGRHAAATELAVEAI